jgi:hypothetical protein
MAGTCSGLCHPGNGIVLRGAGDDAPSEPPAGKLLKSNSKPRCAEREQVLAKKIRRENERRGIVPCIGDGPQRSWARFRATEDRRLNSARRDLQAVAPACI